MSPKLAAAMAVLLLVPGQAPASDSRLPQAVRDGPAITVEELRANSAAVFEAFAGGSGGPVSKAAFLDTEIPASVLPNRPDRATLSRLFKLLDADDSGTVTRAEWNDRINEDLRFADENGDGVITVEELARARENLGVSDALGMLL